MLTFKKNSDNEKKFKTKSMIYFERVRRLNTTLMTGRGFHSFAYETFAAEYNKPVYNHFTS